MRFLISERELHELKKGTVSIDELTKPENIALFTWSGEDVKELMKDDFDDLDLDESIVMDIAHVLGHADIGDIVTVAVNDWVDDFKDKKMQE